MKKWRNLRDTFKRQLEVEKKIRAGHIIKKKVYIYFKHMSFLLPHVQSDSNVDGGSEGDPTSSQNVYGTKTSPRRKVSRATEPATYANSYTEEIDEDKHFLMSLVPSFKRMTEDEKLTAKMEILKVIKTVKKNSAAAAVDRLSFHEVESLANETNLMGVKLEVPTELCEVGTVYEQDTEHETHLESK